jgi:hypothetical protein
VPRPGIALQHEPQPGTATASSQRRPVSAKTIATLPRPALNTSSAWPSRSTCGMLGIMTRRRTSPPQPVRSSSAWLTGMSRSSRAQANSCRSTDVNVLLVLPDAGRPSCRVRCRMVAFGSGQVQVTNPGVAECPEAQGGAWSGAAGRRQRSASTSGGPAGARRPHASEDRRSARPLRHAGRARRPRLPRCTIVWLPTVAARSLPAVASHALGFAEPRHGAHSPGMSACRGRRIRAGPSGHFRCGEHAGRVSSSLSLC